MFDIYRMVVQSARQILQKYPLGRPLCLQISTLVLSLPIFLESTPPIYLYGVFIYTVAIYLYLIASHRDNLVLMARTLFLGIVGYPATYIRLFYPEAFFDGHMQATQTIDIVLIMFMATKRPCVP